MDNEEMERLKAEKLEKAREELRKIRMAKSPAPPPFPDFTAPPGEAELVESAVVVGNRSGLIRERSGGGAVAARRRPSSSRDLPRKQLKRHHILGKWPLVIWGGVLLLALLVHFGFVRETPAGGEVESLLHVLETNEDAVVASLAVSKWETVEAGQELARLSAPGLEQSLAEVEAALARRHRELEDRLRLEIENLKSSLKESEIESEGLAREQKILAEQVASLKGPAAADGSAPIASRFLINSAVAVDLAELNSDLIKAESKLAKETVSRERITAELAQREEELRALQAAGPGELATPEEAAEKQGLESRIAALVIKAPVAGSVSALHRSLGERIGSEKPLLEIVEPPRWILVEVPAERFSTLAVGAPIWIRRSEDPGTVFETKIARMSPVIRDGGRKRDRLREIFVECPSQGGFFAGQKVQAFFDNPADSKLVVFNRELKRCIEQLRLGF
jgi:multidrug resistance efflux pump